MTNVGHCNITEAVIFFHVSEVLWKPAQFWALALWGIIHAPAQSEEQWSWRCGHFWFCLWQLVCDAVVSVNTLFSHHQVTHLAMFSHSVPQQRMLDVLLAHHPSLALQNKDWNLCWQCSNFSWNTLATQGQHRHQAQQSLDWHPQLCLNGLCKHMTFGESQIGSLPLQWTMSCVSSGVSHIWFLHGFNGHWICSWSDFDPTVELQSEF